MKSIHIPKIYSQTISTLLFLTHLLHSLTPESIFPCFPFQKAKYSQTTANDFICDCSVIRRDQFSVFPFLLLEERIWLALFESSVHPLFNHLRSSRWATQKVESLGVHLCGSGALLREGGMGWELEWVLLKISPKSVSRVATKFWKQINT